MKKYIKFDIQIDPYSQSIVKGVQQALDIHHSTASFLVEQFADTVEGCTSEQEAINLITRDAYEWVEECMQMPVGYLNRKYGGDFCEELQDAALDFGIKGHLRW